MIIYRGISEDKRHVLYMNVSSETIPVRVKVYEGYTNGFIFYSDLDMTPFIEYFTYIYPTWKNRKVLIYHRETNQLLAPIIIDGDVSLGELDKFGYIKNLFNKETDFLCQSGILDVLREHHFDRQYKDYCDVEEGDIVVDIGFNYGIFSLGALYKGASKIYGLEPNKQIYNIVKELYPKQDIVSIYPFAISNKNENLTFKIGYNTLASSIVGEVGDYKESYEVKCFNFYDFLKFHNITKIDFLKIDCEGTEYDIFESIPDEFFKTIRKIHVEYHFNDGEKVLSLIDKLERNNFEWKYEYGRDRYSSIGLIFAKNKNV